MKVISPPRWPLNVHFFLTAALAGLLCAGCVGHREMLTLSNSLTTSSQAAASQITKLQEAANAEAEAHKETREAFRKVYTAWRVARTDVARANMAAAYARILAEINQREIKTLQDLQSRRLEMRASLDEKLSAEIVPLDDKEATLK